MNNNIFTSPDVKQKVVFISIITSIFLCVEIINLLSGYSLNAFGIRPRELGGLIGIFISPFLHGSVYHLISNIFPFVILGGFIVWQGISHFIKISLTIMIATGIMVWLFGPSLTIIVGASGVIFGYLGYLFGKAYIDRNITDILIAVAVLFMYGGMIFGIFPGIPGVSWESHLFGFISGFGTAWLWKK